MKKGMMLGLVMLGASMGAQAAEAPKALAGRWGFGLDSVAGATPASVLGSAVLSAPNAAAVRYWFTDKVGIDGLLAMDLNSIQTGTASGTPGTVASGTGFGLAIKYNLSQPSRDLLGQLLARGTMASSTQSDPTGLVKLTTSTTSLFVGAGFEAFIPHWEWLSIEGSVGLSLTSQSVKPDNTSGGAAAAAASAATQSSSRISVGGTGFTPLNLSIHAYF